MNSKTPEIIDGIECYCPEVDSNYRDYSAAGLDNLYRSESHHFWFLSRSEFIVKVFKKYVNKNESIIEIGAGTGNVSRGLMAAGYKPAVGELHISGLRYAKSYGIDECYQFDLYDPPFIDRFDVVGMFDVLEHLEDVDKALNRINSMLHNDGKLIITVPAHMWLWNLEDRYAGHKLRYTKKTIQKALEKAGYEVIINRYFFVFITPLLWLRSVLHADVPSTRDEVKNNGDIVINPIINNLLLILCRFENKINNFLPNIFGGSLFVVAKKN